MFDTPIALFIYKRPEETQKVFAEIAKIRPRTLLIVADGPKSDAEKDATETARAVTERIDWDCNVIRHYAPENMGCRSRMASGIDWVFEQVEEAIILEDDCIPEPSFFHFCSELLLKYRSEPYVGAILGTSFVSAYSQPYDYFFSRYFTVAWGWASWRRSWQHYDVTMASWPTSKESGLLFDVWQHPDLVSYWSSLLDRTYYGEIDTWDYQWFYSWWKSDLLNIVPAKNLISNIGFGANATHAQTTIDKVANLKTYPVSFPLREPPQALHEPIGSKSIYSIYAEKAAKYKRQGQPPSLLRRVLRRLASFV